MTYGPEYLLIRRCYTERRPLLVSVWWSLAFAAVCGAAGFIVGRMW